MAARTTVDPPLPPDSPLSPASLQVGTMWRGLNTHTHTEGNDRDADIEKEGMKENLKLDTKYMMRIQWRYKYTRFAHFKLIFPLPNLQKEQLGKEFDMCWLVGRRTPAHTHPHTHTQFLDCLFSLWFVEVYQLSWCCLAEYWKCSVSSWCRRTQSLDSLMLQELTVHNPRLACLELRYNSAFI